MVPFGPSKNKVFKPRHKAPAGGACREGHLKRARPRQEELAGTAARSTRPRQEELAGKADQGTTRDLLRRATRPARTGERQAPGRDKASTAARRLPRQVTTPRLRSSSSTHASLWGHSWRMWREAA